MLDNSESIKEQIYEQTIRPKKFTEYIGQDNTKRNLKIIIQAANIRNESPDHLLFYGPPGLGKTTLANIIASELGTALTVTSGPALERAGDIISILTNLQPRSVLFIDEIHRLAKNIEEVLYLAMEDKCIDLTLGKGPTAKTLRLDLPDFTLIGATTKIGALSNPFRDRFGGIFRLDFYKEEEIAQILSRSSKILQINIDDLSLDYIAKRARMTPRIANRLLKRVQDLATVKEKTIIDLDITKESLEILEIDELGLDYIDRKLIETLIEKFSGGPVGLQTIAASITEDTRTIEEVIEPFLIRLGLIKRTNRGRVATDKAIDFFSKNILKF